MQGSHISKAPIQLTTFLARQGFASDSIAHPRGLQGKAGGNLHNARCGREALEPPTRNITTSMDFGAWGL